jgi:hypothetical protein
MHLALDLKLLILIGVANGMPVVAQNLFGHRFTFPVDCGAKLADGQPLLGPSKSMRGIAFSLLATTAGAPLLGIALQVGALIAAAAMLGDLCSSFLKRRMKLPASSMAIGLDQLPESLFPMLACAPFFALSALDIAIVASCFFAGELLISRLLYRFHLRDRPY